MNVERRVEALRDVLVSEHHVGEPCDCSFAAVVCNGCGRSVLVRGGHDLRVIGRELERLIGVEGWSVAEDPEDGDFCQECLS